MKAGTAFALAASQPSAKEVQERDWDGYWSKHEENDEVLAGRSSQVSCSVCGAVVLIEDRVQTDRCPSCGTFLANKPEAAKGMIQQAEAEMRKAQTQR